MVVLEAQGGAVLGVAWPLPSGSASGPLRILLPALAATPLRPGQLKGRGYTACTSLMTLMWFRCHIPHLTPTQFNGTLIVSLKNDRNGRGFSSKWAWLQNFRARFAHNCTIGTPLQEILDPRLFYLSVWFK